MNTPIVENTMNAPVESARAPTRPEAESAETSRTEMESIFQDSPASPDATPLEPTSDDDEPATPLAPASDDEDCEWTDASSDEDDQYDEPANPATFDFRMGTFFYTSPPTTSDIVDYGDGSWQLDGGRAAMTAETEDVIIDGNTGVAFYKTQ